MTNRFNGGNRRRNGQVEEGRYDDHDFERDHEAPKRNNRSAQRNDSSSRRYRGYNFYGEEDDDELNELLLTASFRNAGSKSYSDERIAEEARTQLSRLAQIDPHTIQIMVNKGEVTLRGAVDSRWAKRTVEEIVEALPGVWHVHNQLQLQEAQRVRQT